MKQSLKDRIKRDFNKAADTYEQSAALQKDSAYHAAPLLRRYVKEGADILDLGCGTGVVAHALKDRRFSYNLVQLDIAEKMLSHAAQYGPVVNADMEQLPFADESFDGVVAASTLQWAENFGTFIKEAERVLKPSGVLLVTFFAGNTLSELKKLYESLGQQPPVNAFPDVALMMNSLREHGLSVVKTKEETRLRSYDSMQDLFRSIKIIGARFKREKEQKGLLGKSFFNQLEKQYFIEHPEARTLDFSWDIFSIVAQKR